MSKSKNQTVTLDVPQLSNGDIAKQTFTATFAALAGTLVAMAAAGGAVAGGAALVDKYRNWKDRKASKKDQS